MSYLYFNMKKVDKNILIKYLLGECDEQESQTVHNWLELSDDNKKEFESFKKVWLASFKPIRHYQAVDVESELQNYLAKVKELEKSQPIISDEQVGTKKYFLQFLKVAAIIIVSFGIGALISYYTVSHKYNNNYADNIAIRQIIAPKGSKSIAVLPDGTKVWLNAGTSLKYTSNYGIDSRDVELIGEAYFKVVTNPEKPFTVITSELKIKAYGTAFNVKAYPDEKLITTTLEEGKITIIGKGVDIALKPKQNISYERRMFKPNSETQTNTSQKVESPQIEDDIKPTISTLSNVNTQLFTSWKDDRWIINSEGLVNISVLLERKFNVSVKVESDELLKYKFTGTFTNETLEQILNVFRFMAPLSYKIDKGIVTIGLDKKRKNNYLETLTE